MESGPVIALASGRDWWRQKLAAVVPIRRGGSVVRVEVPRANIRPVVDVPTPTNRAHLRGVDEVRVVAIIRSRGRAYRESRNLDVRILIVKLQRLDITIYIAARRRDRR